jgi:hypothetical protein
MNDTVKARIAAFHQRNGGECFSDGTFYFYKNGAMRDIEPLGPLIDPPDPRTRHGQLQLATNILKFYQLRLKKAVAEYDDLNTRLAHQLPADPDMELKRLKELQANVDACKADVEAADKAVGETELGRQRRMMLAGQAEQRQRFLEFQRKRAAIKV